MNITDHHQLPNPRLKMFAQEGQTSHLLSGSLLAPGSSLWLPKSSHSFHLSLERPELQGRKPDGPHRL